MEIPNVTFNQAMLANYTLFTLLVLAVLSSLGLDACIFPSIVSLKFLLIPIAVITFITSIFGLKSSLKEKKNKKSAFLLIFTLFTVFLSISYGFVPISCNGLKPPEVCTMPAGMTCARATLTSDGAILQLTLINGLTKPIVVTSVTCTKKPDQFIRLLNTTMENGQGYAFLLNCNGENGELLEFSPEDEFSGKINVEYYFADEGPNNLRKISGNVYVKAD
ncbi:MAG: hypothetical protein V1909_01465 [Candidatus Micrarchaeota archaeon]